MGEQEAGAFLSVAAALELAVAGGQLRPGARGWRAAQQAVARRHLAAAGPELDGRSWLEVVVAAAERLSAWARSRGGARRALVDPVLPRWLASRCCRSPSRPARRRHWPRRAGCRNRLARGGASRLPGRQPHRPTVIEAVRRFGWHPLPDPPRGDDDVFKLWMLRDLERDLGAVRRSGRRLVATRASRVLAGDPRRCGMRSPTGSAGPRLRRDGHRIGAAAAGGGRRGHQGDAGGAGRRWGGG
jgi:hypothetical protein